jgi:MFS family permease
MSSLRRAEPNLAAAMLSIGRGGDGTAEGDVMTVPRGVAFWLMGGLLGLLMIAAAAPSPLYGVYQADWHFSAATLTAVFAVYVVALLAAFLVAGRLSDHLGRRPVIIAALVTEVVAMACFGIASAVPMLYVARIVQGLATGAAIGAVSAALLDLQPAGSPQLASLVNSAAPTSGLAIGALATSFLVQYGPAPLRLVYWLLVGGFIVSIVFVVVMSEPGQRRPGALASLRPQASVPAAARGAFIAGTPALIAGWALGGLYLALGPSIASVLLSSANVVPGGLVIFLLCGVGAVTSVVCRATQPRPAMLAGSLLLAVGVGGTVLAIAAASTAGFFAGTAFAGIGFGLAFLGTFRALSALAPHSGRAGLIATIYIVSYLAFSLPVIAAGIAVTHFGLRSTAVVYGCAVAVLALGAAASTAATRPGGPRAQAGTAVPLAGRSRGDDHARRESPA